MCGPAHRAAGSPVARSTATFIKRRSTGAASRTIATRARFCGPARDLGASPPREWRRDAGQICSAARLRFKNVAESLPLKPEATRVGGREIRLRAGARVLVDRRASGRNAARAGRNSVVEWPRASGSAQKRGVSSRRASARRRGSPVSFAELVAHAPRRDDELRVVRIELDLPPQAADGDVHRAKAGLRIMTPGVLEQRRAAEDDARAGRQLVQDVELLPRELDAVAADVRLTRARDRATAAPRGAAPLPAACACAPRGAGWRRFWRAAPGCRTASSRSHRRRCSVRAHGRIPCCGRSASRCRRCRSGPPVRAARHSVTPSRFGISASRMMRS